MAGSRTPTSTKTNWHPSGGTGSKWTDRSNGSTRLTLRLRTVGGWIRWCRSEATLHGASKIRSPMVRGCSESVSVVRSARYSGSLSTFSGGE